MHGLGTVVPRANGDALRVQDGRDIVWVDVAQSKGDNTPPMLRARPQDAQALDVLHAFVRVAHQRALVGSHVVHAQIAQVVHGRAQGDGLGNGRRARLELVRQVVPGRARQLHLANHLAPAQEGGHRLQEFPLAVEDTDTAGAAHLMTRKREEVTGQILYVHGQVGHTLGAIDQDQSPHRVGPRHQFLHGVDGAQHVGHGREREYPGALCQQTIQRLHVQETLGGDGHPAQGRACHLTHQLPGDDVRMVLHFGDEHLIARLEVGQAPGVRDQVDALGGVADVDNFTGGAGVDEAGNLAPRVLVHLGGRLAQVMDATVDVGVGVFVDEGQGVDNLAGLLSGRGAIQVHEGLAVYLLAKDGEILANPLNVEGLCFGSGLDRRHGAFSSPFTIKSLCGDLPSG